MLFSALLERLGGLFLRCTGGIWDTGTLSASTRGMSESDTDVNEFVCEIVKS